MFHHTYNWWRILQRSVLKYVVFVYNEGSWHFRKPKPNIKIHFLPWFAVHAYPEIRALSHMNHREFDVVTQGF